MLTMINAPRYPTAAQDEPQDSMLIVARSIINAIPLHRRTPSAASSSASTSTLERDERAPLLIPTTLKSASNAVRSYGSTLIKHNRSESRKAELKRSISRPISQEQDWWSQVEEQPTVQAVEQQKEEETNMTSVYSTRTWTTEIENELNRVGAFEYDEMDRGTVKQNKRASIESFTSSERSYTFF